MIPAREMFVHNLSGSGPHRVGVLPDLQCNVGQRNDDGKGADDLSEIGQVVEVHGLGDNLGGPRLIGLAKFVRKVRQQPIDPSRKVFRKAWANICQVAEIHRFQLQTMGAIEVNRPYLS